MGYLGELILLIEEAFGCAAGYQTEDWQGDEGLYALLC